MYMYYIALYYNSLLDIRDVKTPKIFRPGP